MTELFFPASKRAARLLTIGALLTSQVASAADSSQGVSLYDFVEYTTLQREDITGLYLTMGGTAESENNCIFGGQEYKGSMHNVVHTIEPVYFNTATDTTPLITVFTYPEGLIQEIVFGEGESGKFINLQYNLDLLKRKDTEPTKTDGPDSGVATTFPKTQSYGVWIGFPFRQLEQVYLAGDIVVRIKEGFTNMASLVATDRVAVEAIARPPILDTLESENSNVPDEAFANRTLVVTAARNASVTLEAGHERPKPIEAVASGSADLSIAGSVEHIQCTDNAVCIVDGKVSYGNCTDSFVAGNATLETDDCSCVAILVTAANASSPINGVSVDPGTPKIQRSSAFGDEFFIRTADTANCLDTTYVPPVRAVTDGPSTTHAVFSCPALQGMLEDETGFSKTKENPHGGMSPPAPFSVATGTSGGCFAAPSTSTTKVLLWLATSFLSVACALV